MVSTNIVAIVCLLIAQVLKSDANRTCVATKETGRLNFELLVDVLGVPGPVGPEGQKGQKGELGVQGRSGVRGETGQKGEPGDVGPVGPQGDKGEKGRKGEKGDLGLQGVQGIQGPVGLRGPIGREGPQGPEGPEGPQGVPGTGSRGPRGLQGSQGVPGPAGPRGVQGPQGVQGIPGDTVLTSEEFTSVCQNVSEKVLDSLVINLKRMETEIDALKSIHTKCGIFDVDWRRIAYLDMTQPSARCPSNLTEHSNSSTGQRACGRSSGPGCSSVIFPSRGKYSQVCGLVAGYESGSMNSFNPNYFDDKTINDVYVDGISITHGNPRQHLWTYVVGLQEAAHSSCGQCPGDRADYPASCIPDFVGNDYYCETGWVSSFTKGRHVWDDALWDGKGCHLSTAHSCDRYGWFHKQVNTTTDYMEVRLCANQETSIEDVLAELIEIWVL